MSHLARVASVLAGLPLDDAEVLARSVAAKWRTLVVEDWRLGWRDTGGRTLWHAFVLAEGRGIDCARAWESLASAGVIPHEAVDNDRRAFDCTARHCECGGWERLPFPTTMHALVSFACLGWENVATAEAVALEEYHDRILPLVVAWRLVPRLPDVPAGRGETLDRVAALGIAIEGTYSGSSTVGIAYPAVGVPK